MGNETLMRESARSVWLWPWLEGVAQDARHTIRSLRASPLFSAAVVLTFALGIGANAAMFSLVDRLFFRPPAFLVDPASTNRVYLYRTSRGEEAERSGQYQRYADLARWSSSFSEAAAVAIKQLPVGDGEATRDLPVGVVTASFFDFFNAPPAIGRYFGPSEDTPPIGSAVAVLTDAAWKNMYGARRDVIGETLRIGPTLYTIIGVAPPGFVGLWAQQSPIAFVPVSAVGPTVSGRSWWNSYGHYMGVSMIVRRKTGVTVAAATADLTSALRRSFQAELAVNGRDVSKELAELRPRAIVAPILEERGPERSSTSRVATWLVAVSLIILVIACANVANLELVRTIHRQREIAVRLALGVGRSRLAAQLVVETALLAIAGGNVGLFVATWGSSVLRSAFLHGSPAGVPVVTDARTLLFAAVVTIAVGLIASAVPAIQASRGDLSDVLKSAPRDGAHHPARVRSALLVAQGTLSVALLAGSGLFVRSLWNVQHVRLGYDVAPVLVVDVHLRGVPLDSTHRTLLNANLLDAAKTTPGVERAALMKDVPFEGESAWPLFVTGIDSTDRLGQFDVNPVSPEYFATIGTRLLRGRPIESTDVAQAPRVMVVGASMAEVLWPGLDPIGRCVKIGADTAPCTYVVGVAETVHAHTLDDGPAYFMYYVPLAQSTPNGAGLYVRSSVGSQLAESLRRRLQLEMPGVSYVAVRPLARTIDAETQSWRSGATVFTAFGLLALVLAALGLYSVIAYGVTRRTQELGVRMALGARPGQIVRLVVGEGVRLGAASVALGLLVSLAAGRWLAPLLFKESAHDPYVLGAVTGILVVVSVLASSIPAWRASRLDPRTALQVG